MTQASATPSAGEVEPTFDLVKRWAREDREAWRLSGRPDYLQGWTRIVEALEKLAERLQEYPHPPKWGRMAGSCDRCGLSDSDENVWHDVWTTQMFCSSCRGIKSPTVKIWRWGSFVG